MMVKIGIIGAGAIVRRAHLPTWKKISPDMVKAIADIDLNLAKKVSEEFSIPIYTDDYKEIINDPEINIVDIATPTPTHFEIIMAAIDQKKNIIVEKPLVLTLEEAFKVKRSIEKNGLKLTVIQNYRYYPCVIKTKMRISMDKIGQVVSINGLAHSKFPSSWTRGKWLYHKAGVLYDFLPHLIDLIIWLNKSDPKYIYAIGGDSIGQKMDFFTNAQILIEFKNGTLCSVNTSWLTGSNILRLDIHGTGGHIFLDVKDNTFLEVHGTFTPIDNFRRFLNEITSLMKRIANKSFFIGPIYYYLPFFKDFLTCLEFDTLPKVTIEDALKNMAILDAAKISIENNEVVKFDDLIGKF
ncbi:MAG: Gfo/Idh/MocA family oxidoreductase [Candidatus Aminicenantes bacterium]|nr:Gfo/Idh/MocA family oxidoreductase [Candidatus Aminicenantes bacterium]